MEVELSYRTSESTTFLMESLACLLYKIVLSTSASSLDLQT